MSMTCGLCWQDRSLPALKYAFKASELRQVRDILDTMEATAKSANIAENMTATEVSILLSMFSATLCSFY